MNVLFVTADQWRGDALSALGHPVVRTPALDALAREGTLFRRHFTNAYPCGPARACLHTGLYAHTHRSIRNGTPLDARHDTLALMLRRAGHDPLLFGYTDTSLDPRGRAADDPARHTYESVLPGFRPIVVLGEDGAPWLADLAAKGYDVDPAAGRAQMFRGGLGAPASFPAEDGETRFLVDRLIAHVEGEGREGWFAHLSLICPHPPFLAPPPWDTAHGPDAGTVLRGPSRWDEAAAHPLLAALHETLPMDRFVPGAAGLAADLSETDLAQLRAAYWGMIEMVDAEIGRLHDWLRRSGRDRDTLIVFTSDHGEMLGDHYLLGKCAWFDAAAHVPLVVRDPRPAADAGRGRVVDDFTEAVDILPTLLEALDIAAPPQLDGASLLPFCRGETPSRWRDAAHWEHDFGDLRDTAVADALGLDPDACGLAVRREALRKYVHFAALPALFYDLAHDPGELQDRSCDPAWDADRLACAQGLLSWRMRHEDLALTWISLRDGYLERTPS